MLLEKDLWWPDQPFLRETVLTNSDCNNVILSEEQLKKTIKCENDNSLVTLTVYDQNCSLDYIISISNNYLTNIRILSYVLRFIYNVRNIKRVKVNLKVHFGKFNLYCTKFVIVARNAKDRKM